MNSNGGRQSGAGDPGGGDDDLVRCGRQRLPMLHDLGQLGAEEGSQIKERAALVRLEVGVPHRLERDVAEVLEAEVPVRPPIDQLGIKVNALRDGGIPTLCWRERRERMF